MSEPLHIEGDAQDITTDGDLHISGSVSAGSTIKAQGKIVVGGEVEPGATITASGDIQVSRGINGETTKVVTLSSLTCYFIRNSAVVAVGDISVGYYLSNARVKAGGVLSVGKTSNERGGSVVGGTNFATGGVIATTVGSQGSNRTTIGLVASPETEARLSKMRRKIDFCQTEIQRIVRTLGLRQLSKIYLVRLIQKTPAQEKKFVRGLIEKLLKLVESKKELNKQHDTLTKKADQAYAGLRVMVREMLYAGVLIRIGQESLEIEKDMGAIEAFRTDWGIEVEGVGS